jgi:hypothetical protein
MLGSDMSVWPLLARWRARAFLVAGGLLLASPATKALALLPGVSPPVWLVALLVFPGLLAALAGLIGMYPQLADETPLLAFAGGVVAAFTGSGLTLLFGWVFASSVFPSLGALAVTEPPGWAFVSLMVLIPTGFALFGVASLRAAVHSRSTGYFLLGFAVPWVAILAVTPVYGSDLPGWLALAVYGVMPIVLLATGYSVRDGGPLSDGDALPGTPSAG